MLNEIGRICVKLAGRDAGKKCIIVDILDENNVLIDGNTRRRKCNITHLEPTNTLLEIKNNASHDEIVKLFENNSLEFRKETKSKQATEKLKKQHINRNNKPKEKSKSIKSKN